MHVHRTKYRICELNSNALVQQLHEKSLINKTKRSEWKEEEDADGDHDDDDENEKKN